MSDEIKQFSKELEEALLSLDETKIRDHQMKWNKRSMPTNSEVFWGSVHKTITGRPGLPIEFRRKSKAYLDERGLHSFDDGEL